MKQIHQYEVYLVDLNPTIGSEINKTRPCLVISPDEMNLNTSLVIIAPMTTKYHNYPTRIEVNFMSKDSWIILDQIRTLDKKRLIKPLGRINGFTINKVKSVIKEMLVD